MFRQTFAILLTGTLLALFVSLILAGPGSSEALPATTMAKLDLSLELFASGLDDPIGITHTGPGDDRLFVVERAGRIKIVLTDGTVLPTPFLDISDQVDFDSTEEGLLGLVFHPDYAANGTFYVNYTHTASGTRKSRISKFQVTANTNIADPNSEETLLTVNQPYGNHNAGDMHFGPDNYLYIPLGDGGSGGDPDNNAQDLGTLLGKIVRINVDSDHGSSADCFGSGSGNYTVPPDNPFINGPGGTCDEIWATGLRNPWRSSFDRLTGDLYLGDVGQNRYEEIDFQPAGSTGGENYGWRCYEGNHPFNLSGCGPSGSYTFPIFEYENPEDGCSVTGGYVYRGEQYPFLFGHYLLTDYCSGRFWDLVWTGARWQATEHTNLTKFGFVSFGEDASGELYVVNRSDGNVYQLQENSLGAILSIDKQGPLTVDLGEPITYTLTVENRGNLPATNLIISDTIPAGATYIPGSGGTLEGNVVEWTIDDLAAFDGKIQTTFAVTAEQTIINNDYKVIADGGYSAQGNKVVLTILVSDEMYLPFVRKN